MNKFIGYFLCTFLLIFGATTVQAYPVDPTPGSIVVGNETSIPEPSTMLLLGAGLVGLVVARSKLKK